MLQEAEGAHLLRSFLCATESWLLPTVRHGGSLVLEWLAVQKGGGDCPWVPLLEILLSVWQRLILSHRTLGVQLDSVSFLPLTWLCPDLELQGCWFRVSVPESLEGCGSFE